MPAISVIMPVYNGGEKVKIAINSVLEQTFQDFELIIVNDGSTDNSLDICQHYASSDIRVKIIHQENRGISSARNAGINAAAGKYLAFIDNDDFYLKELLMENFNLAEGARADLVKFSYLIVDEKQAKEKTLYDLADDKVDVQFLESKNILNEYIWLDRANRLVYVWDALIRADVVKKNQIFFDESFKRGHEDIAFCLEIYPHLEKVVVNNKKYYIHIKYKSSTSKATSSTFIADTEKLINYEIKMLERTGLNLIRPDWLAERIFYYVHLCIRYIRKPDVNLTRKHIYSALNRLSNYYSSLANETEQINYLNIKAMDKFYLRLFARNRINMLSSLLVLSKKMKKYRFKR